MPIVHTWAAQPKGFHRCRRSRSDLPRKSGDPCLVTFSTKAMMDCFGAVSFHDGKGSPWARASFNGATKKMKHRVRRRESFLGLVIVLFSPERSWLAYFTAARRSFSTVMNGTSARTVGSSGTA